MKTEYCLLKDVLKTDEDVRKKHLQFDDLFKKIEKVDCSFNFIIQGVGTETVRTLLWNKFIFVYQDFCILKSGVIKLTIDQKEINVSKFLPNENLDFMEYIENKHNDLMNEVATKKGIFGEKNILDYFANFDNFELVKNLERFIKEYKISKRMDNAEKDFV